MIGVLFDTNGQRVVDVFGLGDQGLLMNDLLALYNQATGEHRTSFRSAREAREKTVQALTKKWFPELAAKTPEVQSKEGPVARARAVFEELKGHPRKDVLAACVRLGVNPATAATQYQKWRTAVKTAEAPAKH